MNENGISEYNVTAKGGKFNWEFPNTPIYRLADTIDYIMESFIEEEEISFTIEVVKIN